MSFFLQEWIEAFPCDIMAIAKSISSRMTYSFDAPSLPCGFLFGFHDFSAHKGHLNLRISNSTASQQC